MIKIWLVYITVDTSFSNVNSVNINIDENDEAVSSENDDVADNHITINGERYISLSLTVQC